jgi:hypothetical protein
MELEKNQNGAGEINIKNYRFDNLNINKLEKIIIIMDENSIDLGQEVSINPLIFDILKEVLDKTPFPEESTVENLPSPQRALECLEEIAASGKILTEEQRDSYRMIRQVYPEYL